MRGNGFVTFVFKLAESFLYHHFDSYVDFNDKSFFFRKKFEQLIHLNPQMSYHIGWIDIIDMSFSVVDCKLLNCLKLAHKEDFPK